MAKKMGFSVIALVGVFMILELASRLAEPLLQINAETDRLTIKPPPPRRGEEFRIFAYGGSTVQGTPSYTASFIEQIKFQLKRSFPGREVEIFNFGLTGKSSSYVRRAIEKTIRYEPDLILVMTGNNEYLSPNTRDKPDRAFGGLSGLAFVRILQRAMAKLAASPRKIQSAGADQHPYQRGTTAFADIRQRYRENVTAIIEMTRRENVPMALCTLPSNLLDWPPAYRDSPWSGKGKPYEAEVGASYQLLREGRFEEARQRAIQRLNQDPDDASFLYILGRAQFRTGRLEQAKNSLSLARDFDPYPWRVLSEFNADLRSAADSEPEVLLIDVESAFEEHAASGIPGFDLFVDNCHPNARGNAIIATEILKKLAAADLLSESRAAPVESYDLDEYLDDVGFYIGNPPEHVKVLLFIAKYCMSPPFYYYTAARENLESALEIVPEEWEVWANLATVSLLEGNVDRGRTQLSEAIRLKKSRLDPGDRARTPYLKEALASSGLVLEDLFR